MPLFDTMLWNQKWSIWDTWKSYGRKIMVHAVTAQHRMVRTVTGQKRLVNALTAMYRKVITITGG